MNSLNDNNQTITWITLKEASRLLGCSVKTIRRRIAAGTWRSMIEYQGQKAIRLVAQEDVLDQTSLQRQPSYSAIDSKLAVHALEDVHSRLDRTIAPQIEELNQKFSSAIFGSRVYLVVSLLLTIIILVGFIVVFSDSREAIIGERMVDMKDKLSTMIKDNWKKYSLAEIEAKKHYQNTVAIISDSNKRIKNTRGEIKKLSSVIDSAYSQSVNSMEEVRNTRDELSLLQKEITELRAEIKTLRESLSVKAEPETPLLPVPAPVTDPIIIPNREREEEAPSATPNPPSPSTEKEGAIGGTTGEKKEATGFLGIF